MSQVTTCPNCTMRVASVETLVPGYDVLVELSSCTTGGLDDAKVGAALPLDKLYRAAMRDRKNHKLHVCKKADEAKAE